MAGSGSPTLGVFEARGQVQLPVSVIDPAVSVGAGVLARRQVRARLAAAGLMGRQRQLRTNVCPLRVGVVAPAGQGLADFVGVLQASPLGIRLPRARHARPDLSWLLRRPRLRSTPRPPPPSIRERS